MNGEYTEINSKYTEKNGGYTSIVSYSACAELQALAEIIGPYGIRFVGEKLMEQVCTPYF